MIPLLLALSGAALAWTQTAQTNGCTFMIGEKKGNYETIRAECNWPIAPAKLQGILGRLEDHDVYFSSVAKAERLSNGLYRQVHQASGISDREIILEMGEKSISGGKQYWWRKAADQSQLTGANVEAVADTGFWEVTANADGTSRVVYQLYYDPGGSVPSFLVRWFQTSGTQTLVGELRSYAETH